MINKYFKLTFIGVFALLLFLPAYSQEEVKQIQPTLMVIPYTKQGQDLRTMLDSSITTRVAILKTQEAFDNRGFTTIDFTAKLNATKVDATFKGLNQSDLKSKLIESSGADIYVEVEAEEQRGSGGKNSVRLNIKGYDAFTGRLLGSKTVSSHTMRTEKFDKLVEQALKKTEMDGDNQTKRLVLEEFLGVMQGKFDEMIENGRVVKIIFALDANAEMTYDDEVGEDGDFLRDVIDDWIDENAYKGNYHSQGVSGLELIYDEVRIPLRDDRGRNLTTNKYAREVRKFCRKIKDPDGNRLDAVDAVRGGTIYITFR